MPKPTRVIDPRKKFSEWMTKVNSEIASQLGGLNSDHIPDFSYHDNWKAGVPPKECARKAIRAMRLF